MKPKENNNNVAPTSSISKNDNELPLIIKAIIFGLAQVGSVSLVLLIPAILIHGKLPHWPRANIFLSIYLLLATGCQLLLAIFAPESLKSRMKPPISEKQDPRDKWITILIIFSIIGAYSSVPILHDNSNETEVIFPLSLSITGLSLNCIGYLIMMLASYQNSFAVTNVQDQVKQVVVDTGMYAHVRHPMYTGLCLYMIGIPLWFDCLWSLGFVGVFTYAIYQRMEVEEDVLTKCLSGYDQYKERVCYRLVPFCV